MRLSASARVQRAFGRAVLSMPRPLLSLAAGRLPHQKGHTLDPQVQVMRALARMMRMKQTHELPLAEGRAEFLVSTAVLDARPPALDAVRDTTLPGPAGPIPARIYVPRGAPAPAPALVYFHGGGFVVGSPDSVDGACRFFADAATCIVVSIDYRLAPEHKFPAAVDDAVAAVRHVIAEADALGIDRRRVAVGGDSAGGNLSAVVAIETRADDPRPCLQLLIYPAVDMTMSFPSIRTLASGFFLEKATMDWFLDHYLPAGHDRRDPRASPLYEASHRELPPAFVATAGFDPLRDEGQAYAEKLRAAGTPCEHRCYGSLFHGFLHVSGAVAAAREPLRDMAAALAGAFAR